MLTCLTIQNGRYNLTSLKNFQIFCALILQALTCFLTLAIQYLAWTQFSCTWKFLVVEHLVIKKTTIFAQLTLTLVLENANGLELLLNIGKIFTNYVKSEFLNKKKEKIIFLWYLIFQKWGRLSKRIVVAIAKRSWKWKYSSVQICAKAGRYCFCWSRHCSLGSSYWLVQQHCLERWPIYWTTVQTSHYSIWMEQAWTIQISCAYDSPFMESCK